jgi:integrase
MAGKRPLTPEEQESILTHLEATGRHRDRLFVLLGLYTGFRAREILALQVKHLVSGGAIGPEIWLP